MWRVHFLESERGWGQSRFHYDYEDEEKARSFYNAYQPKDWPVPDVYIIATLIEEIKDTK